MRGKRLPSGTARVQLPLRGWAVAAAVAPWTRGSGAGFGAGGRSGYARWRGGIGLSLASSKPRRRPRSLARRTGFAAPARPGCAKLPAVARPRPIRRLIDGSPDDPGRVVARRAVLLLVAAVLAANVVGAIVVFVLVVWVLPL